MCNVPASLLAERQFDNLRLDDQNPFVQDAVNTVRTLIGRHSPKS